MLLLSTPIPWSSAASLIIGRAFLITSGLIFFKSKYLGYLIPDTDHAAKSWSEYSGFHLSIFLDAQPTILLPLILGTVTSTAPLKRLGAAPKPAPIKPPQRAPSFPAAKTFSALNSLFPKAFSDINCPVPYKAPSTAEPAPLETPFIKTSLAIFFFILSPTIFCRPLAESLSKAAAPLAAVTTPAPPIWAPLANRL